MERCLYLLRHAKSSWEDPRTPDHERPLAPRGRRATELISGHLRQHGIDPELVLCSTARRTQETLAGLSLTGRTEIAPELYRADCGELLRRLSDVGESVASVIVIGHNPALQLLALKLSTRTAEDTLARAALAQKFPTGALATLRLSGSWSGLAPGRADLIGFVRPKALLAGGCRG